METITVTLTIAQATAIMNAIEGFEPDTASYDPEAAKTLGYWSGWSPEEVEALNSAHTAINHAVREDEANHA